jgi:CRISPR system Cascade subunit CasE
MMFLSTLLIDVGRNPDRLRPGRLWLRNVYRVHQRLCMAFPSKERKDKDKHFLEPYSPDDFPESRHIADMKVDKIGKEKLDHVHSPRNSNTGFLFRIDPQPVGNAVILVLSAIKPDWDYAFHNADHFLAAPPQTKEYNPSFTVGQRFKFRLTANPTKKISTIPKQRWIAMSQEEQDEVKTRHGKRVPVPSSREINEWRAGHPEEDPRIFIHEKLIEWLSRWRPMKGGRPADSGFAIDPKSTLVQPGYVYMNKEGKGQGKRLRLARYNGSLTVTDPDAFIQTLISGIGPAKAFGFGLLSIAPMM